MSISSLGLDAFFAIVKCGSFSAAAKLLHVSQSAVSQRLLNLEAELGTPLLVRDRSKAMPTAAGQELLRYCNVRDACEAEILQRLRGERDGRLAGHIRVGGFSSVLKSIVLPALSPLILENPNVGIEVREAEVADIWPLLRDGQCDDVLTPLPLSHPGIVSRLVGYEQYVMVCRAGQPLPEGLPDPLVILDHDADDATTAEFFRIQDEALRPQRSRRLFLDNIEGIIAGVKLGWGWAVLPRHLVGSSREIQILSNFKPMALKVYHCHFEQPYTTALQQAVRKALAAVGPRFLA